MKEKRRDIVKVIENVTNEKLDVLVKGLRKIRGFDFFIDTFILIE